MNIDDIAVRLEAIAHPTRLQVFRTLVRVGGAGLPVGQLQDRLGVAASTLSHHLSKLVAVGLVIQERQGTTLICRADFNAMRQLVGALEDECCVEEPATMNARGKATGKSAGRKRCDTT